VYHLLSVTSTPFAVWHEWTRPSYHLLDVTSTSFAVWHIMIWSLVTRLLNLLFRVTSVFVIYSVLPVHVSPYDKYSGNCVPECSTRWHLHRSLLTDGREVQLKTGIHSLHPVRGASLINQGMWSELPRITNVLLTRDRRRLSALTHT